MMSFIAGFFSGAIVMFWLAWWFWGYMTRDE